MGKAKEKLLQKRERFTLGGGRFLFGSKQMGLIDTMGFDDVEAFGVYLASADFGIFHSEGPRGIKDRAIFDKELRGLEFSLHHGGASEFDIGFGRNISDDRAFAFD